jgi:hypothetical protein
VKELKDLKIKKIKLLILRLLDRFKQKNKYVGETQCKMLLKFSIILQDINDDVYP